MSETGREWAARTRAEQGMAVVVDADELLDQAAAILRPLVANDGPGAQPGPVEERRRLTSAKEG